MSFVHILSGLMVSLCCQRLLPNLLLGRMIHDSHARRHARTHTPTVHQSRLCWWYKHYVGMQTNSLHLFSFCKLLIGIPFFLRRAVALSSPFQRCQASLSCLRRPSPPQISDELQCKIMREWLLTVWFVSGPQHPVFPRWPNSSAIPWR